MLHVIIDLQCSELKLIDVAFYENEGSRLYYVLV